MQLLSPIAHAQNTGLKLRLPVKNDIKFDARALQELNQMAAQSTFEELDQNLEAYLLSTEYNGLSPLITRMSISTHARNFFTCAAIEGKIHPNLIQSFLRVMARASQNILKEYPGRGLFGISEKEKVLATHWDCVYASTDEYLQNGNNLSECGSRLGERLNLSFQQVEQLNINYFIIYRAAHLLGVLEDNTLAAESFAPVASAYQEVLKLNEKISAWTASNFRKVLYKTLIKVSLQSLDDAKKAAYGGDEANPDPLTLQIRKAQLESRKFCDERLF